MTKQGVKRKVILVTDGDEVALKSVEAAAQNIGGRCISATAGNPTPLKGPAIVELIKQAPHDPVVIMFDDNGKTSLGKGEKALYYVAEHPDIEVMGILAVASNSGGIEYTNVDCAVNKHREIVEGQIDKEGNLVAESKVVLGDTVSAVNYLRDTEGIFTVGIGDLGKMEGMDNPASGAAVTTKAMQYIIGQWELKAKKSQTCDRG
ncbi:MAG: stage V sporulation protein AE [Clostridia bacterium]|nr:stage V sporulation protein AE [Clostridia bacterium]